MQFVVLKGHQGGYQLTLKQNGAFTAIIAELSELFVKLSREQSSQDDTKIVGFKIDTEKRLLTDQEKRQIQDLIEQYPQFKVEQIESDVITKAAAQILKEQDSIHMSRLVIRSGQEVQVDGDVLFIGAVHRGGILRATGSVYVVGKIEGVVHAGFPDRDDAIVVGDLSQAIQVRIADTVDILADSDQAFTPRSITYINDLHLLDYGNLDDLKTIRPKLYNKIGEA
ncbi:septum site-determining protein MinC [Loigolactobacillus zhaoyuanensis]|uniref:Septum site-determining protein MinC n=1 Tax=Loigolactobacillus zhaoyuanensis TaxID=2486017 RepID=A0ABW8UB13_9LACO|nr:septum site-determining protein MinC [Loigolactobacillus zhaoyuanensis]